jgi:hypothetical protein
LAAAFGAGFAEIDLRVLDFAGLAAFGAGFFDAAAVFLAVINVSSRSLAVRLGRRAHQDPVNRWLTAGQLAHSTAGAGQIQRDWRFQLYRCLSGPKKARDGLSQGGKKCLIFHDLSRKCK